MYHMYYRFPTFLLVRLFQKALPPMPWIALGVERLPHGWLRSASKLGQGAS